MERIVDCPFGLAVNEAHAVFPMMEASGSGTRLRYRDLNVPLAGALRHPVVVRFHRQRDLTEPGRVHDEIAFDWNAQSRWLPNFNGVLRFRIEAPRTRVVLSGAYVAPFGAFGRLFDRIIGRRLAVATLRDVINRLAQQLEARWTEENRA